MSDRNPVDRWIGEDAQFTRRDLMKGVGGGGLALAGGSLLAACGGSSSPSSSSNAGTSTSAGAFPNNVATPPNPSKGGNLRVAMTGNGTAENYNPFISSTPIDSTHTASVFDPMRISGVNGKYDPGLVLEWNPNKDFTAYELKTRDGVTWHDGKPFVPEDLIYTLRTMGGKTSLGSNAVVYVDLKGIKKTGKNLVHVPLTVPVANLEAYFGYVNTNYVVQDGTTNYSKPVGTGPYKLQSFTPGQRSVLVRNPDYWRDPYPYVDQLEIISIDDADARLNALSAGQIDIALNLPYAVAKANLNSDQYKVVVSSGGVAYIFYMRVDSGPFKDPRVRQAMRLAINRPAMIEAAMSGFADVGNDLQSPYDPFFLKSHKAAYDPEKAKSLLKQAGQEGLQVTLQTSEVLPGFTDAATVFAQQATAAGIKMTVKREPLDQYFNPAVLYLKMDFAQDAWPSPSIPYTYSAQFLSDAFLNETHQKSKQFDQLFLKAQAQGDHAKAQELWNEVQQYQIDQGGVIVWAFWRSADACSHKVRGFGEAGSGWLVGNDDERTWRWGFA